MKKVFLTLLCLIIGGFLTQGFQCASPEMTTAKLAIRNSEWEKATTNLEKELSKNPKNIEAWIMLTQVHQSTGRYEEAAKTVSSAEKNVTDDNVMIQVKQLKSQIWVNCYNQGVDFANQYFSSKNTKYLDSSIRYLKIALEVKPDMPNTYSIVGSVYEEKGNKDKSLETYNQYATLMKSSIDFAREKNIHFDKPRKDVIKELGAPLSTKGTKYDKESDSIITDSYKINGNDVYIFSVAKSDGQELIYGWRYNPPTTLLQMEREQPITISISPYASLAQHYFEAKDYGKAIENVSIITTLEPFNADANNFLVQIYDTQGKKDDAINYIAGLVKKDPSNKLYRAQYGDILLRIERYDDAIAQYEEALKLDPNFVDVARNLAAAYKNKAVVIQKRQQEMLDKDKNYKPNLEEYFPFLRKSAEYFENARKHNKYSRDIEVLGELINIYDVTDNKEKLKVSVAEMEAFEPIVPDDLLERYYLILIRVYDRMRNTVKSQEAQEKLNKLYKK